MSVETSQPQSLRQRSNGNVIQDSSSAQACQCENSWSPNPSSPSSSSPKEDQPPKVPKSKESEDEEDEYPPWADPEIVARKQAAKKAKRKRKGKSEGKYIPEGALKEHKPLRFFVPKSAEWGYSNTPGLVKILFLASFLGVLSVTVPYWAGLSSVEEWNYMHFGLWHLCVDKECTSIHDNVIPGRSVPAWWSFVQGTHCIGVTGVLVSMGFAAHNMDGSHIFMPPTTYVTALCILGISIFQQFISLFTLLMYMDETDFLYLKEYHDFDFHWGFYCALFCLILTVLAALFLLVDEDATTKSKGVESYQQRYWWQESFVNQLTGYQYEQLINQGEYAEVYDEYYVPEEDEEVKIDYSAEQGYTNTGYFGSEEEQYPQDDGLCGFPDADGYVYDDLSYQYQEEGLGAVDEADEYVSSDAQTVVSNAEDSHEYVMNAAQSGDVMNQQGDNSITTQPRALHMHLA